MQKLSLIANGKSLHAQGVFKMKCLKMDTIICCCYCHLLCIIQVLQKLLMTINPSVTFRGKLQLNVSQWQKQRGMKKHIVVVTFSVVFLFVLCANRVSVSVVVWVSFVSSSTFRPRPVQCVTITTCTRLLLPHALGLVGQIIAIVLCHSFIYLYFL